MLSPTLLYLPTTCVVHCPSNKQTNNSSSIPAFAICTKHVHWTTFEALRPGSFHESWHNRGNRTNRGNIHAGHLFITSLDNACLICVPICIQCKQQSQQQHLCWVIFFRVFFFFVVASIGFNQRDQWNRRSRVCTPPSFASATGAGSNPNPPPSAAAASAAGKAGIVYHL